MRGQNESNTFQDFLNPESMLTPGVAGALVMMIANALAVNFDFSDHGRKYAGLILSFIIGLLVLSATRDIWKRFIFYVLNSLVIFTVAFGSANLIQSRLQETAWLISSAFAQSTEGTACDYLKKSLGDAQNRHDSKAVADLNDIIARNCRRSPNANTPSNRFFGQWK
jgi:hypothetical protein